MSRNLGELGKAKQLRDDYFLWFGEVIRVSPTASEAVLVDFMQKAESMEMPSAEDRSPEGLKRAFDALRMVKEFVQREIHPDDFETFWKLGLDNGYGLQDFMGTAYDVLGLITERPTQPLSDSSPGQPQTEAKSGGGSSPAEVERSIPVLSSRDRKVKERLEAEGRPDMALMVLEASEAKASARSKAPARSRARAGR